MCNIREIQNKDNPTLSHEEQYAKVNWGLVENQ